MAQAIVKKKSGISVIWILPLVALIVGGWIGYKSYRDRGEMITIVFEDISGVTAGKTQIIHRGLPIGLVKSYDIDYGKKRINLQVEVIKDLAPHLTKDIQFWIVRPEISTSRISGLDTLLSGSYIALKPGISKEKTRHFIGLNNPPPIPAHDISHHIRLVTTSKGSISVGAPILFKKIKVGEVVAVEFNKSHTDVDVEIVIYKDHANLVNTKSYFWNASGIQLTADLQSGLNFEMGTLDTLLSGGIAFRTTQGGESLAENSVFKLYPNKEEAQESNYVQITLDLLSPEGISVDTEIKYKGVVIGDITALNMDQAMQVFTAQAAIYPKAKGLLKGGSDFWVENSSLSLSNLGSLKSVLTGPSISMTPGRGEMATHFQVKSDPPKLLRNNDELIVILRTPRLGSLNIGSPVLYRQIVVGEVSSFSLSHNSQYVEIFVKIQGPYTPLVREHSRFWMASGIRVEGGLMTTMKFATESLEALMTGGIAFATPNDDDMGIPVDTGYQFTLHEDVEKKWLKWSPEIPISFYENTIPKDFRLPMVEEKMDVKEVLEKIVEPIPLPGRLKD